MTWYKFFFPVKNITQKEALRLLAENKKDYELIDVRQPHEHSQYNLEGSKLIPLPNLSGQIHMLDKDKNLIIYCRSGSRSSLAVRILRAKGFEKVYNISGGISA